MQVMRLGQKMQQEAGHRISDAAEQRTEVLVYVAPG
jgi:hypothetical protein